MGKPHGIDVVLHEKVMTGADPFGRPIWEETATVVHNVVVGSPTTQEVIDTLNLTGKQMVYQLGIPKGDTHKWTDCRISFFGQDFRAIGPVLQGIEDLVPLDWHKVVRVERYE